MKVSEEDWTPIEIPQPVAAHEGYADSAGVALWYWDTGGDGEAIVLCHPASQSSLAWSYQQPVFAQAGYRVIAYCRRGHYKSETGPADEPGTAVGDLCHLLDSLAVDRCHLLGAAAGGITAMALAVAAEQRLLSLIIAGSIFAPDEQDWRDFYARLGLKTVFSSVPSAHLELGPSYRATNPDGFAQFEAFEQLSKPNGRFMQPSGADVTWQSMEALQLPCLLLTGEADLYAPPPLQSMVASHIAHHELMTLRETGHASYWERPEAFNEAVLDFIARHGRVLSRCP